MVEAAEYKTIYFTASETAIMIGLKNDPQPLIRVDSPIDNVQALPQGFDLWLLDRDFYDAVRGILEQQWNRWQEGLAIDPGVSISSDVGRVAQPGAKAGRKEKEERKSD